MRLRSSRLPYRALSACATVAVVLATTWWAARWSMLRQWRRDQLQYHASSERENRDFERRLRQQIDFLHQAGDNERAVREVTDRIFELLRLSAIVSNSREVASWRSRPPSPERTAVALRWAEAAVDEARYHAALHGAWRQDFERGGMGHDITDDEVPRFKMPAGWTGADLLYSGARRDF